MPNIATDITHNGQVVGTIRHEPNYHGHWQGEAWIATSIHDGHGTHAFRTEYEADKWVRDYDDVSRGARR